jgi:hypothetical protein
MSRFTPDFTSQSSERRFGVCEDNLAKATIRKKQTTRAAERLVEICRPVTPDEGTAALFSGKRQA